MEPFSMLQLLLSENQFELIFPETDNATPSTIRLVYLMNDAVESFLLFHNARLTGTYDPAYEGELDALLTQDENRRYALIVHQGGSVVTLFFEDLTLENHYYDYSQIGHFWMKGYEYLRQLEYRIAILRDKTPPELEIEAFVHGAMCMSVSGRCLLSNYMAGRDANRGQCAQPCRWKYYLSEETRPGQLYEIGENENGSYILNANDLCTAPFIDLICKAGVDSLKIEGRAKTFYYVASVTAAYRKALDAYLADPANDNFELPAEVYEELTRTSHRHYSPGFYFGREQAKQATDSATYIREWEFVGTVDRWENGVAHCQQRGKWSLGDTLEALCPDGRSIPLTPEWIENEAGERVDSTPHAMEKYTMPTPELPPMSLLRRKTAE